MGILRSIPDKSVVCTLQNFQSYSIVSVSTCGWQIMMEDYQFSFVYSEKVHVLGIVDGQSGPQVAEFSQNQIEFILRDCELMRLQQYQAALQNLCFTLDQKLKKNTKAINQIRQKYHLPEIQQSQDTPAFASLIICILAADSVTIGNLGDCKSYVSYKNSEKKAVLISGNHIIQKEEEVYQISKKGGFVVDGMINGKHLISRGIGHLNYKNLDNPSQSLMSCEPSVFSLRPQDINAIIMGSSGLWERPQMVLREVLYEKKNPILLKQHLSDLVLNLIADNPEQQFGRQNMTIKAIIFN